MEFETLSDMEFEKDNKMPKPNNDQILTFVNDRIENGETPEEAMSRVCDQYDISGVDIALAYHGLIGGATIDEDEPQIDEIADQETATDPVVEPNSTLEPLDEDITSISSSNADPNIDPIDPSIIDPSVSSEVASNKKKK